MSWINDHATEITALGSLFMSCATFIIIFFNLNQLKLNSRSLNVDINFKVFELRKAIYKQILGFISDLNANCGFRQYLVLEDGEHCISASISKLKESVENSKHLFCTRFAKKLEAFLLNIEHGLEIEQKIAHLKDKDPSTWQACDQEEMRSLGDKSKEYFNTLVAFDTDEFLEYLNVSNFHKNMMHDDLNSHVATKLIIKTNKLIFALVNALIPKKKSFA